MAIRARSAAAVLTLSICMDPKAIPICCKPVMIELLYPPLLRDGGTA